MTYCVGLLLEAGLVLIADSRTNAGVDNFSSYRKLHTLAADEERQIFLCSSGSLSMTQSVLSLLEEGLPPTEPDDPPRTIAGVRTMFRAAQLVGEAVQIVNRSVGAALAEANIGGSVSLLLGGRIGSGPPTLYLIYGAGNFIECTEETPFFQIGETKYGKPILDRGVRFETPLGDAVKVAFLSFDSAMRSNLGVARPLDLVVMPADPVAPILTRRIEPDDAYFNDLSLRWAVLLHEATAAIPNPPFLDEPARALDRAAE
jgi:putative proteasome-type protease